MRNIVAEVRGHGGMGAALFSGAEFEFQGSGHGRIMVRRQDLAQLQHLRQHLVPAADGLVGVDHWIVIAGAVDQPGQQGGLRQCQVRGRGAEEVPCRRLDPVGLAVEEYEIQIALKDLVLAELLLQRNGQLHFAELVPDALLPAEDHLVALVLGQEGLVDHVRDVLLGDRGGALLALLRQVEDGGPKDPLWIDAWMLIEAAVLNRHDGVPDVGGHPVQGDLDAVLGVERGDRLAVRSEDFRGLRRRFNEQFGGEIIEVADGVADPEACRRNGRDHKAGGQDAAHGARSEESDDPGQGGGQPVPAFPLLRHCLAFKLATCDQDTPFRLPSSRYRIN